MIITFSLLDQEIQSHRHSLLLELLGKFRKIQRVLNLGVHVREVVYSRLYRMIFKFQCSSTS